MRLRVLFPRLCHLWADSAYGGKLIEWIASFAGWVLEIVKRTDEQKDIKGFVLLPRRWVRVLLGRGADIRLAGQVPSSGQGLRRDDAE